jgi:uncharacterized protein (DUF427 family)
MKATWKGVTIAESDDTVIVEGNHYFPSSAVNMEYMRPSNTKSTCPWKGVASYYTINVGSELNVDAAWCYPEPKEAAENIQGRVAFRRGVEVTE